jgi:glutathione S-transferase
MSPTPHLISFNLCPYVQRSVITLLFKDVPFDITYIDLQNKPDWFLAISPLGKVPALQVGEITLFESAVINEYLDEVYGGASLHPADPLVKALNRAWTEFGSTLLMSQYYLYTAKDESAFQKARQEIQQKLVQLEGVVQGPFFNGEKFALIDAAYAPLWMRFALLAEQGLDGLYAQTPKVAAWAEACLALPAVQKSVVPEFAELFKGYVKGTYLGQLAA